ncbi:MAG: undecaprenyl-diphosphate phosphatase [Alphaproteobacteria bacterium]|nr:undecaprenyl-diphosphate phosphatase [Alphaproteobacteria bacterium]
MTFFQLFILAALQGLTEFLPVSSSGHLVLAPRLLGEVDQGILIDVALHIGTLLAVLLYYRRDVWQIGWNVLQGRRAQNPQARNLGWYIALGSIPAFAFGALVHVLYPDGIRSIAVITATTLFFGLLMGLADMFGKRELKIADSTLARVLIIGCAQALALIPGTSRSGVTMTAARFLGYERVEAARLSFLLGIPATAGAGAMGIKELFEADNAGLWHQAFTAIGLSFLAGLFAIHFMMVWLKRAGLMPFVFYRLFLGGFLLVYFVL